MGLQREFGKGGFLILLVCVLCLILLQSVDEFMGSSSSLLGLLLTAVFLSAIYSVSGKREHVFIGLLFALPAVFQIWLNQVFPHLAFHLLGRACGFAFMSFMITLILRFVFSPRHTEVTRDLLAGAALVYLLMAMGWAYLYSIADILQPEAFTVDATETREGFKTLFYFSFVTITSLGYGDVTPATTLARSLAILEAVIGQLYLVIAVASLVGIRLAQRHDH